MYITPIQNRISYSQYHKINNINYSYKNRTTYNFDTFNFKGKKEDRLENAIENGSVAEVKKELEQGANINCLTSWDMTPLGFAAFMDKKRVFKYLLEQPNIDVNFKNKGGVPVIFNLCANKEEDFINLLLESNHDVDLSYVSLGGKTIFDILRGNGNYELSYKLQDYKTDPKAYREKMKKKKTQEFNITALSYDKNIWNEKEITNYFEKFISDKNYQKAIAMLKKTPFIDTQKVANLVNSTQNIKLIQMFNDYTEKNQEKLLNEYKIKRENFLKKEFKNLTYEEAKNNKFALTSDGFENLIEKKEFNPEDKINDNTLFEWSCLLDTKGDLANKILTKHKDINAHYSLILNISKDVRNLICDYMNNNYPYRTIIEIKDFITTAEGFDKVMQNKDFDPNHKTIDGKTLFEIACNIDDDLDTAKQLLSKYENIDTDKIKTKTKNRELVALINEYETIGKDKVRLDKINRLILTPETQEIGVIKLAEIINAPDFNPEMKDSVGNSLLHIASSLPNNSCRSIIQNLINKGVNVNSKNIAKQNSLISAIKAFVRAKTSEEKVSLLSNIKFLLDKGINIDEQDNFGQTAFHYACFTTSAALLTLLLTKNPNIYIKDIKGNYGTKYLRTAEMKNVLEEYLKRL